MSIWVCLISHPVRLKYNFYEEADVGSGISGADMGIGFLSWSGWRGCDVIFHVKLLVFGRFRALDFLGHV